MPQTSSASSSTGSGSNFTQVFTGPYQLISTQPFTVATFSNTGPGAGVRTGIYPGAFTASYSFSAVWVDSTMTWSPSFAGTFRATMSGLAKSSPGQMATGGEYGSMTGTMKAVFNDILGGKLTVSGPVTLYSNGGLYADLTGTGIAYISSTKRKIKVTSGTLYQIPVTGDDHWSNGDVREKCCQDQITRPLNRPPGSDHALRPMNRGASAVRAHLTGSSVSPGPGHQPPETSALAPSRPQGALRHSPPPHPKPGHSQPGRIDR